MSTFGRCIHFLLKPLMNVFHFHIVYYYTMGYKVHLSLNLILLNIIPDAVEDHEWLIWLLSCVCVWTGLEFVVLGEMPGMCQLSQVVHCRAVFNSVHASWLHWCCHLASAEVSTVHKHKLTGLDHQGKEAACVVYVHILYMQYEECTPKYSSVCTSSIVSHIPHWTIGSHYTTCQCAPRRQFLSLPTDSVVPVIRVVYSIISRSVSIHYHDLWKGIIMSDRRERISVNFLYLIDMRRH